MQLTSQCKSNVISHARARIRRTSIPAMLALLALTSPLACHRGSGSASTPRISLEVTNKGFFDVNVFVIRSPVAQPIRLGTVNGGMDKTFGVSENDLQTGQTMVLQVRTIAGNTSWVSSALTISTGSVAKLDVVTTSSGDLSQTRLYRALP
jgi:hypothetical protein